MTLGWPCPFLWYGQICSLMLLQGSKLIQHIVIYFQAYSYSTYPMHSGERYKTNGPLVFIKVWRAHGFGRGKAFSVRTRPYAWTSLLLGLHKDLNLCGLGTKHRREETIPIWNYSVENQILQGIPIWSCMRGTCNIVNFMMSEFVSILVYLKYISLTTNTVSESIL